MSALTLREVQPILDALVNHENAAAVYGNARLSGEERFALMAATSLVAGALAIYDDRDGMRQGSAADHAAMLYELLTTHGMVVA